MEGCDLSSWEIILGTFICTLQESIPVIVLFIMVSFSASLGFWVIKKLKENGTL
jgi:hypothetical protein